MKSSITIKSKQRLNTMQIELLLECIENKLNFDEIHRILGIDLSHDKWIVYLSEREQADVHRLSRYLHSVDVLVLMFKSKLNMQNRNMVINQIFAYPTLLYFLSLNLMSFVILSLIPSTYASLFVISKQQPKFLLSFLQFFIGLEWGVLILILLLLSRQHKLPHFEIYAYFYKRKSQNLITLWQSHTFATSLHHLNTRAIPLHTSIEILSESSSLIQKKIALHIQTKLEQGTRLQHAFDYLDDQLGHTLGIEDFERKIDVRLERYLHILEKQIRYELKRYAGIFTVFVYSHITLMVVLVYSTLLYPLQLLEQIV